MIRTNAVPPKTVYHKIFTDRFIAEFLEVRLPGVEFIFSATGLN